MPVRYNCEVEELDRFYLSDKGTRNPSFLYNGVAVDVSYFSDKGTRNPSFLYNGVAVDGSYYSDKGPATPFHTQWGSSRCVLLFR